jgi:hypothetical protein
MNEKWEQARCRVIASEQRARMILNGMTSQQICDLSEAYKKRFPVRVVPRRYSIIQFALNELMVRENYGP